MRWRLKSTASRFFAQAFVCSGADQREHQSSSSLAFVRGIHRWPVNSPHWGTVTRKMSPSDNVIMRQWFVISSRLSDFEPTLTINLNLKNKLSRNLNLNTMLFIEWNEFDNVFGKVVAIFISASMCSKTPPLTAVGFVSRNCSHNKLIWPVDGQHYMFRSL